MSAKSNSSETDVKIAAIYSYDLELNAEKEIIGGEWYGNRHPDFLWTPVKGPRARGRGAALLIQIQDG